jgi:hypothetical protein
MNFDFICIINFLLAMGVEYHVWWLASWKHFEWKNGIWKVKVVFNNNFINLMFVIMKRMDNLMYMEFHMFIAPFLFLFFSKTKKDLDYCLTTTKKTASLMRLLGFLTSGELKYPIMAPLFIVVLKRVYISRQLHMILEVIHVHPFPTLPQQSCSWGFSNVEMNWVVLLMSRTKVKLCIFFSIL